MRRLSAALVALLALPAYAQDDDAPEPPSVDAPAAAPATPAAELPDDPQVAEAREAYNAQRYGDAAAAFTAIARRHPKSPAVYRALARAATWADQPAAAVRAYRHYLALAPRAADADKIEAELALVMRKLDKPPAEGPPAEVTAGLTAVRERVKAGRYAGAEGAIAALATLEKGKYVGPELADAREAVDEGLARGTTEAFEAWWSPAKKADPARVKGLADGWKARAEAGTLPFAAQRAATTAQGLDHLLAGRHQKAIDAFAPIAPGEPRLRYAQAIALARAERFTEAEQLLAAMPPEVTDRRVTTLLGLVRRAQGRIDHALEAWQAALEPTEQQP